eukprot:15325043-Ditylum_brightwellii.AAC.1
MKEYFVMQKGQKDIKSRHDYAERLVIALAQETRSEYFDINTSSSMEGIAVEDYPDDQIVGSEPVVNGEVYSFLSYRSNQNVATTTVAHMRGGDWLIRLSNASMRQWTWVWFMWKNLLSICSHNLEISDV